MKKIVAAALLVASALALANFAYEQVTLQSVTVTTVEAVPAGVYSNPAVFNITIAAAVIGLMVFAVLFRRHCGGYGSEPRALSKQELADLVVSEKELRQGKGKRFRDLKSLLVDLDQD